MSQYTLKNTCMIVMILLACIALNPTWAGGDNYQANIRINAVPITRKRDAWTRGVRAAGRARFRYKRRRGIIEFAQDRDG